ncbi:zinc knuckle [Ostertagia ostertagi]
MEKLHVAFEMLEDTKQEAELESFDQYLQVAVENTNIADQFCANLQRCKAERRDTKSQIQLLDKITAMMSQLAINGQEVDQPNSMRISRRGHSKNEPIWKIQRIGHGQKCRKSGILQRREYVEQTRNKINAIQESSTKKPIQPIRGYKPTCIYCKRFGHQSTECRTVKESERLLFLIKNKLCLNCGKPYHTANVCLSPPCQKCGKLHHISLCMALSSQQQRQNPQGNRLNAANFTQPVLQQQTREPARNTRRAPSKKATRSTPITNQNAIVQDRLDT